LKPPKQGRPAPRFTWVEVCESGCNGNSLNFSIQRGNPLGAEDFIKRN